MQIALRRHGSRPLRWEVGEHDSSFVLRQLVPEVLGRRPGIAWIYDESGALHGTILTRESSGRRARRDLACHSVPASRLRCDAPLPLSAEHYARPFAAPPHTDRSR